MIGSEDDARRWLGVRLTVPRETLDRLDAFVALLHAENARQNLVSSSTLDQVWRRHIADSAQLLLHSPEVAGARWLDVGTGAGFPGLVIAALSSHDVTMVEPRKLRAEFLKRAAHLLAVTPIVLTAKVQQLPPCRFDVISARAVAALTDLIGLAAPFSTEKTRLIFAKGRNAQSELEAAQRAWQGEFRSEPSLTDPEARIVIVERLRGRRPGKVA